MILPGLKLFDLTGRVAIVTGGSKGLGLAMAQGLASAGAGVVLVSRHEEEAKAAAAEIGQAYCRPAVGMRAGRDATYAIRLCVGVADTCMQFAGGSALFESNPVQKGWRDVHGTSAHYGFNTDFQYGTYGRLLLGLPIPPGMF